MSRERTINVTLGILLMFATVLAVQGFFTISASAAEESGAVSADEIAKELANPNASLANLTFKNQFTSYTGDLPGAGSQNGYTLLFQPVFPFSLGESPFGGKANLFIRPAIPFIFDQPTFNSGSSKFDGKSGLGDTVFDLAYGATEKSGVLWAVALVGTIPTATNSLGSRKLALGPGAFLAQYGEKGVYGLGLNHQWDVVGSGDRSVCYSTVQPVLTYLPGGGWSMGSYPIMAYDWVSSQWTIPLNATVGRTVMLGKTPVKIAVEVNYYVEQRDAFGPEWMIGLNITPVVPNFIEKWVRGSEAR